MVGRGRRAHPSVFTRSVRMKSSSSTSWNVTVDPMMPALAKKTSSRPYRSTASETTALTAVSSAASKRRVWTSTPGYSPVIWRWCVARCVSSKSHR